MAKCQVREVHALSPWTLHRQPACLPTCSGSPLWRKTRRVTPRSLLRAEFALAKDELRNDLQIAKRRALGLALGALLLQAGITLLALGFVLLLGATATAAFATGSVLAALALISALYGARAIHGRALENTQKRMFHDTQGDVRPIHE